MNTCIAELSIEVKEWQGQRVVTFKDIDRIHQRKDGASRKNFTNNKDHFIANVDYFKLQQGENSMGNVYSLQTDNEKAIRIPPKGITLFTESGYLMLVKSFTDDLAWDVQRALVNNYFHAKDKAEKKSVPVQQAIEPVRHFFGGFPVLTVKDVVELTGRDESMVHWYRKRKGVDAGIVLTDRHLKKYKLENGVSSTSSVFVIFREADTERLFRSMGCYEKHKSYLQEYFKPKRKEGLCDSEIAVVVQQASLLYKIATEIKDPVVKEMNLKAVTSLLMSVGLWNENCRGFNGETSEWDPNTLEGWNKGAVLLNARRNYPYGGTD